MKLRVTSSHSFPRRVKIGCLEILEYLLPSGEHTKSYWKWSFIVEFPMKHGDFPWQNVNVHQAGHPDSRRLRMISRSSPHRRLTKSQWSGNKNPGPSWEQIPKIRLTIDSYDSYFHYSKTKGGTKEFIVRTYLWMETDSSASMNKGTCLLSICTDTHKSRLASACPRSAGLKCVPTQQASTS